MMSNTSSPEVTPPSPMRTDPEASNDPIGDNYHPLFSSPDADIALGSKDGILFRVHSYTLRTTSGWFHDMLTLPQKEPGSTEIIYVDEDASTLEALLRMICGLPIPSLDSEEAVEPVLYAAEKYDMPGPLSVIRACLLPRPLLTDPLKLYGLTCRYGWDVEMQAAATQTLTLNIHSPEHRPKLRKLTTDALLSLIELHHDRRHLLRKRLNEPPFVRDNGTGTCSNCHSLVNYNTWRELKFVIDQEMEIRPLGDTIINSGLNEWPAARVCWEAKCPDCHRELYDQKETIRAITQCIEQLPKTISVPNSDTRLSIATSDSF
ncbi:unnamed protein product [Somion occarium]|uniref:BTB domain-containing protein n=1 Tax=Somion occarium TaxID=3059160 RepID=A0ABP1DMI0_9APHY